MLFFFNLEKTVGQISGIYCALNLNPSACKILPWITIETIKERHFILNPFSLKNQIQSSWRDNSLANEHVFFHLENKICSPAIPAAQQYFIIMPFVTHFPLSKNLQLQFELVAWIFWLITQPQFKTSLTQSLKLSKDRHINSLCRKACSNFV